MAQLEDPKHEKFAQDMNMDLKQVDKVRFEVKAKNNRLYCLVYSQNKTLVDFCDLEQVSYEETLAFITLKKSPYGIHGVKPLALRLCEIFSKDPEWLFPMDLYAKDKKTEWVVTSNLKSLYLKEQDRPQIEYMDEKNIDRHNVGKILMGHISKMTERQRMVIISRYGLGGYPEKTLEQMSKHLGVSRERIKQIEKKAIEELARRLNKQGININA